VKKAEFETRIKVRSYECDANAHVNNAVYLNYLELARVEILEKSGLSLSKLKEMGLEGVVARIEVDYLAPLRENDEITVRSFVENRSEKTITLVQDIFVGQGKPAARAKVVWLVTDISGKAVPFPDFLKRVFGF
jgi:acyl-CoA thioester hydrolase